MEFTKAGHLLDNCLMLMTQEQKREIEIEELAETLRLFGNDEPLKKEALEKLIECKLIE